MAANRNGVQRKQRQLRAVAWTVVALMGLMVTSHATSPGNARIGLWLAVALTVWLYATRNTKMPQRRNGSRNTKRNTKGQGLTAQGRKRKKS